MPSTPADVPGDVPPDAYATRYDTPPTQSTAGPDAPAAADLPPTAGEGDGTHYTKPPAAPDPHRTLYTSPPDADAPAAAPPRTVGPYEIVGELDRGGMGVVYGARDERLDRLVALKMIRAGVGPSEGEVGRFLAEARAAARLRHRGIVPVYEVGGHDGQPYMVMELLEGGSLEGRLRAGGPLPPRGAADLVRQVAGAVQHAHEAGVVHPDLKPANILLAHEPSQSGSSPPGGPVQLAPKVTDFGLARLAGEEG